MRHRKHNHLLGVKKQHRKALVSNLCAALINHGRIKTTLTKAKAIRPVVEKMITRAKKAKASDDPAVRLHHRRQCIRHLRDKEAAHLLFNEKVDEFIDRPGGYVRIYKLSQARLGDSAEMALVELIHGDDEGYPKRRKKKTAKAQAPDDNTPDEIKKADDDTLDEVESGGQPEQETTPEETQPEGMSEKNTENSSPEEIEDSNQLPEEEPEGQESEVEEPAVGDGEAAHGDENGGGADDEPPEASEATVSEEETDSDQNEAKAEDKDTKD